MVGIETADAFDDGGILLLCVRGELLNCLRRDALRLFGCYLPVSGTEEGGKTREKLQVAEWLEEKLGIVVPELDYERAESLPFNEQPSKWDGKPAKAQLPMFF